MNFSCLWCNNTPLLARKTEETMTQMARLHTNVDCPKCYGLLARSKQNHYHIFCHNPECELYGVLFEQPSVELKPIKSGGCQYQFREGRRVGDPLEGEIVYSEPVACTELEAGYMIAGPSYCNAWCELRGGAIGDDWVRTNKIRIESLNETKNPH